MQLNLVAFVAIVAFVAFVASIAQLCCSLASIARLRCLSFQKCKKAETGNAEASLSFVSYVRCEFIQIQRSLCFIQIQRSWQL